MAKDEITIHTDSATQHLDVVDGQLPECPKCKVPTEQGFGLAGGGMGIYDYCPQCSTVVSKVQVSE